MQYHAQEHIRKVGSALWSSGAVELGVASPEPSRYEDEADMMAIITFQSKTVLWPHRAMNRPDLVTGFERF